MKGAWSLPLLLALLCCGPLMAAGGAACGEWRATGACETFTADAGDTASLQRGAALFMNYCLGCHGTRYARYQRVSDDLGIPDDLLRKHLIFDGVQSGSLIASAMRPADAKRWFGVAPPDLSLITRALGVDRVYTYLLAFYRDDTRPYGYNNQVAPNIGMPHVLAELQGEQRSVCKPMRTYADNGGVRRDALTREEVKRERCGILEVTEGTGLLSDGEYRQATYDLVNYLAYTAEPYRAERINIGMYVLLYLLLFISLAALLNREYHKDNSTV